MIGLRDVTSAGSARIRFEVSGTGSPVAVLAHGLTGSKRQWMWLTGIGAVDGASEGLGFLAAYLRDAGDREQAVDDLLDSPTFEAEMVDPVRRDDIRAEFLGFRPDALVRICGELFVDWRPFTMAELSRVDVPVLLLIATAVACFLSGHDVV